MKRHLRGEYGYRYPGRGRPVKVTGGVITYWLEYDVIRSPVAYRDGTVETTRVTDDGEGPPAALTLRQQVDQQLAETSETDEPFVAEILTRSEQSGWLQLTEWPRFFAGKHLGQAARLIDLPGLDNGGLSSSNESRRGTTAVPGLRSDSDRILCCILESFRRVVERARLSLADGKLNVFDQHQLNSFIPSRSARRPVLHLLQPATYKKYTRVFERLLCYVYRLTWEKQGPDLHFRMTEKQLLTFADVVRRSRELEEALREDSGQGYLDSLRRLLDDVCLLFCISLLDHALYGDIYDSLVLGFLAVLAIEESHEGKPLPRPRLCEAVRYTGQLSALIKIAQLLVAERALLAVEQDEADYPAAALEAMQARFMVDGTRSPICWARNLRAYGKAIKDTTTSVGQISWSDDNETIVYRDTVLTMTQVRQFVAGQLRMAQDALATVLLIHPDEDRELVVPPLSLRSLVDNPAERTPGWSFVGHPANILLHGRERWLLDRVLDNEWLRKDFLNVPGRPQWRHHAVRQYLLAVEEYLGRLLLLVHMTGGQPARGTELLTIQYCNPLHGQGQRNIFLENGLVSFVTYYHKGYSVTGSTKIIHRYLPIEVSELLVYYIWLVVPFLTQLAKLAKLPGLKRLKTPYLFGDLVFTGRLGESTTGRCRPTETTTQIIEDQPWPSSKLSSLLSQEFLHLANAKVNVQIWRHIAIAISRRHLQQAKFKRDFIEAVSWAWNDEMAAHSTKLAGLAYARGLDEAPGHVAGAKAEYRRISREWHAWLGFGGYQSKKL
ncbi:hypothetical protein DL764_007702 [Monosporascus ibericus]|uniref:Uncharacterized protein n=1 Tax=Monosporascus ibericus TaxID=155417 RepID=A0A4Q4T259_9PEZI|nr:hypothetical protein DL764_007702 [Monosporascus ibericus]